MRFVEGPRCGELPRGQVLQAAVRAFGIVIDPPVFNDLLRFADAGKPMLVQAFLPEAAVEAFNVGVLRWLAGFDEIELNAMIVSPSVKRTAPEFRAVVHDQNVRVSALTGDPLQHFHDALSR